MTTKIPTPTPEEFRAALVRAIDKKGADYVYRQTDDDASCVYVERLEDGSLVPSCLIGHALMELGVDPEELHYMDSPSLPAHIVIHRLFGVTAASPLAIAARMAQEHQDKAHPWGVALEAFDVEMAIRKDTKAEV